ncbi:MAG: helix-turn-helix transcriptional regulator [Pseudomonadota bacterium]|mgnify:CR=1 FL=1
MKIDEFIGQRAKELRLKNGVTPEKVAVALSLTLENYSALELGRSTVRAVTMFDLAIFYDLPVTYFLDGYENPAVRNAARRTPS